MSNKRKKLPSSAASRPRPPDRIDPPGITHREERRVHILLKQPPEVVAHLGRSRKAAITLANLLRGLPESRVLSGCRLDYGASGLIFSHHLWRPSPPKGSSAGRTSELYHFKVKGRLTPRQLRRTLERSRCTNSVVGAPPRCSVSGSRPANVLVPS